MLALALAIDRLVGDPKWLWSHVPHPIVLMGRAIEFLDARLNRPLGFEEERRRGILVLAILLGAAVMAGLLVHLVVRRLPLGFLPEALIVSVFLAQKSLVDHVAAVAGALLAGGIDAGQRVVSEIVGRDVTVLDEAGVSRAAIEIGRREFFRRPRCTRLLVSAPRAAGALRLQVRQHRRFHDRPPLAALSGLWLGGGALRRSREFSARPPLRSADRRGGGVAWPRPSERRGDRLARRAENTNHPTPAGRRPPLPARSASRSAARAATATRSSMARGSISARAPPPRRRISLPQTA